MRDEREQERHTTAARRRGFVMTKESGCIGLGNLHARMERLEAFARVYARCPCCDDERRCSPDCEHEINAPDQHAEMVAAREALYGKDDE
jgi:hypothetical protein